MPTTVLTACFISEQGTVLKTGDLDQAVKVLGPCFVTTKASKEKSTF